MATASEFTFSPFVFNTNNAVNAVAVSRPTKVRDRRNRLVAAQPGDYILRDEDGTLRVMKKALFEAEYSAAAGVTAPNTLLVSSPSTTGLTLSWTVGQSTAYGHVERNGAQIAVKNPTVGTHAVTGLLPNTGYTFRVRNSLNEAFSAYLTPVVGYTLPVAPATPTSPSKTHDSITISWVNGDATAKTEVHVDNGAGGAFSQFGTDYAAGVTTAVITGLTPGLPYRIKLRHEGALSGLHSAFSAELTVTTNAAP